MYWSLLSLSVVLTTLMVTHGHTDLHLTILHTSDISSRFEQVNNEGIPCLETEIQNGTCYGGMARIATYVNATRRERRGKINVLLLDAGDMLIGDFFNVYRGNATAQLMNKIGYDAMTIGNNEIGIGPDALAPFLQMTNFPVVSANVDASREPVIDGLFSKSAIKTYLAPDGTELNVAIVGYAHQVINDIAYVRNAEFTDVFVALQAEVDALTADGIKHIVVLGHSWMPGYIGHELEIARVIKGVDIVVGGGVNYFHYDGCPPDIEEACNTYPILVHPDHDPKGKVLVVHSSIWGKYIGRLNVMFNENGTVSEWYGNPVLMDSAIDEDPECLADILQLIEEAPEEFDRVVGRTHVLLEGYPRYLCRSEECNMGNLITDAMVWKWATQIEEDADIEGWTNVATAVLNSGGIRGSIEQGNITYLDLLNVLPFNNTFDLVDLEGKYIREMLEHSAAGYYSDGHFLQMAGLRVTYDVSKDPYDDRVAEVLILCAKCEYPRYVPLEDDETYTIALPSFLAEGYDEYDLIAENALNRQSGDLDIAVLMEYLNTWSPVYTGLEGRITIIEPRVDPVDACFEHDAEHHNDTTLIATTLGATVPTMLTTQGTSSHTATTTQGSATTTQGTSSNAVTTTVIAEATTIKTTTPSQGGSGGGGSKPRKPRP